MFTNQQLIDSDAEDLQRVQRVLDGISIALGVDPGYEIYDRGRLTTQTGHQVLSVTTGTAPQGQAATVGLTVGGTQINLSVLLLLGAGAVWLVLRK